MGDLFAACRGQLATPPQRRVLKWLYATHPRYLLIVWWEVQLSFFVILGYGLIGRALLPFAVYAIPVAKILAYRSCSLCAWHAVIGLGSLACGVACFVLPVVLGPIVVLLFQFVYLSALLCAAVIFRHPLGAGPHILAAVLVMSLNNAPEWVRMLAFGVAWVQNGTGLERLRALPAQLAHLTSTVMSDSSSTSVTWDQAKCQRYESVMDSVHPRSLQEACIVV